MLRGRAHNQNFDFMTGKTNENFTNIGFVLIHMECLLFYNYFNLLGSTILYTG